MKSTKVITTLRERWDKPVKSAIMLDPEYVQGAEDLESAVDIQVKFKKQFNSFMTEFF